MFVKPGICLFFSLILSANGCDFKSATDQKPAQPSAPLTASATPSSSPLAPGFLDACALIEKSEIESVQGAPVQSTVPSSRTSGALATSQCYYAVTSADGTKNLSVHLEVTQPDPKSSSPKAVREYWATTFRQKKSKDESDEEKEEGGKPKPVPGLGEEAFWSGNDRAGAVYAIQKDKLVRVSVGGPDDANGKIEKSKTLIAKVLKRIS
jgi:hypothetical protein